MDWDYKDSGFINRNECIYYLSEYLKVSRDFLESLNDNELKQYANTFKDE
jgi:hypothetical protein